MWYVNCCVTVCLQLNVNNYWTMATNDNLMKLLLDIKADVSDNKQSLTSVVSDITSLKSANEKFFSCLEECKDNYKK